MTKTFFLHSCSFRTIFCSADHRERQTHYSGAERHRLQLWRHSHHVPRDVQRACGNPTQCQLHCMCHLKGRFKENVLSCMIEINEETRIYCGFSCLRAQTRTTALKAWRKSPRNQQLGPRRRFCFLARLEITTVRQWRTGRSRRSSTTPKLNTVTYRYTEAGRPQDCWEDWTARDGRSASQSFGIMNVC